MPALLEHPQTITVAVPATEFARRPRRRRLGPIVKIGAAAGVVALGVLAVDQIGDWGNPFATETTDRSAPPLLLSLADLDEYHAATGDFQVIVDIESDTPWVPSFISGERVQYQATGTVDAYVSFGDLDADRVRLSEDGNSATITLPAPELSEARIDPEQSRVLDRDRGVVERVTDAFGENADDEGELYSLAADKIEASADDSNLVERAEDNTREMLTTLAHSLGVDDVTVTFEPAAD